MNSPLRLKYPRSTTYSSPRSRSRRAEYGVSIPVLPEMLTTRTLRPSNSTFPPCLAASITSSYVIPVGLSCSVIGSSLATMRESLASQDRPDADLHATSGLRRSTKFASWGFSEVSLYGVLRSSTRAAVSLCHRPVFVWRTEGGELGEEVLVWSHLVLRHPPVRQDGEHVIAHVIGQQTTVVRVGNRSRRVVGQDIR